MSETVKTASIVLVEDNPADVYLIRQALAEKGIRFKLTCFEDGEEALKKLARVDGQAPDLILLDLNLPKTGGVEVLKAVRGMAKFADVPVAILTSSDSPADKRRAALFGAARYISKPSVLEDFFRVVGEGVEDLLRGRS
jgi:two-component system, chemotaxis family, response regulator Rcp1